MGGSLFARVIRGDEVIVVSLLDLSGSEQGSWVSGTEVGRCDGADVSVLLAEPESWHVDVAVLGSREWAIRSTSEYVATSCAKVGGVRVSVPLDAGWSVLRLTRKHPS